MEGTYILPLELFILMLIWYLPPVLISLIVHIHLFKWLGVFAKSKLTAYISLFALLPCSLLLGFLCLLLPTEFAPDVLGVTDNMLILPMAYIVVLIVSVVTIYAAKFIAFRVST